MVAMAAAAAAAAFSVSVCSTSAAASSNLATRASSKRQGRPGRGAAFPALPAARVGGGAVGGSVSVKGGSSRGGLTRRAQAVVDQGGVEEPAASVPRLSEAPSVPAKAAEIPAAPGVYAVYDQAGTLQYVGLSRKIQASAHVEDLPELTDTIRFATVGASATRADLQGAWQAWVQEHLTETGTVPPGNAGGNTTWTQRRARMSRPEIRILPGSHVSLTVPVETIIDKMVKEVKVLAFIKGTRTAPQCGFSHRVMQILTESKVDFDTINVLDEEHNPGLREAIKTYSKWPTIPQLYAHGEFIGGADIVEEMYQSGELKQALSKQG
eukprot:jgi/Chlat1/8811/Chrsp90S08147